jgi:glycosyltransferase involved in cell wall biosynthesis
MPFKEIARKAKVGIKVLRDKGFLSFTITSLQFIEKRRIKTSNDVAVKHLIDTKVKYRDALAADYTKGYKQWPGTTTEHLKFNWLMPPPGKGSGGHYNIFRFIKYLEEAGHDCQIYIFTQHAPGRVSDIRTLMGDSYPELNASMVWIDSGDEMKPADGIFATSWETAYASFNSKTPGKRFYFVQDFEPYFYPTGTHSVLAENTYRFGFYGVTAGNWLATKLKRDYNMQTDYFDFGSEKKLYSFVNDKPRKEIFFYARPYTERRGFEMGIMALDLFHEKHPEYIINMAGWDVSDYDIPFPYENLKTLEYDELNELYNRCAAGLVMSFTNMSLLPLELLGSGTIPVVNDGENNTLVSSNPYIAYSANNPIALAETLSSIITRKDQVEYAKKGSESTGDLSWEKSGSKFVKIVEREVKKRG